MLFNRFLQFLDLHQQLPQVELHHLEHQGNHQAYHQAYHQAPATYSESIKIFLKNFTVIIIRRRKTELEYLDPVR